MKRFNRIQDENSNLNYMNYINPHLKISEAIYWSITNHLLLKQKSEGNKIKTINYKKLNRLCKVDWKKNIDDINEKRREITRNLT